MNQWKSQKALPVLKNVAPTFLASVRPAAETVVFWAFDEPVCMYPSSVLSDQGPGDHSLVLGPGGSLAPGHFGNALSAEEQPPIDLPPGSVRFGLEQLSTPPDRTVAPMSWMNARFAALATSREKHLRQEFTFVNATQSGFNLGAFDWTVEFWLNPRSWHQGDSHGIVFEVRKGPRGENGRITALGLNGDRAEYILFNWPTGSETAIPTKTAALKDAGNWVHLAFVYDSGRERLRHFRGWAARRPQCDSSENYVRRPDFFMKNRPGIA